VQAVAEQAGAFKANLKQLAAAGLQLMDRAAKGTDDNR
jgi:hypothetical protein